MEPELKKIPADHLFTLSEFFSEKAGHHRIEAEKCEFTAQKLAEEYQKRTEAHSKRKTRQSGKR